MWPSIGIMQGRLLPDALDRLQVFPISDWKKEFLVSSESGFDCFELLYDKEMVLYELVQLGGNYQKLGLSRENNMFGIKSTSVCLDFLAEIPLINTATRERFINELLRAMKLFKNSTVEVLVVPFCDKNEILTSLDLKKALNYLKTSGIDKLASDYELELSLELTLPANLVFEEFSACKFANIGICLDLGNSKFSGFQPEEEIMQLDVLINHVHIKDRLVGGPNVMLGDGDVDFKACFRSLRIIDYSGRFILETRYFENPIKEACLNLNYLKSVVI